MKKIRVSKTIFIFIILLSVILILTSSLISCCNVCYVSDKLNGLRNKDETNSRQNNTASTMTDEITDEPSVISDDYSTETSNNSNTSNTQTYNTEETSAGEKINFIIEYNFDILGDTSKIDFITIIPGDYPYRQKIFNIDYSMPPARIFFNGINKYAEFIITNPLSDFKLKITTQLEVYEYDLDKAITLKKDQIPDEDLSIYLTEEKYIEVNDSMIQNLEPVRISTEYPLDHIEINYNYVMKNLDYSGYNPGDVGAVQSLKNKSGDCTDYTDTFVTLCRASGFPARSIEGYPIDASDPEMGHNWSEIFISDYGWVPFDPTYDDNNGSSQETTFKNLKNTYIYMSFIRNDAMLNGYHYYYYSYWGNGLKVEKKIYINMN
jgi:hypothetical protein